MVFLSQIFYLIPYDENPKISAVFVLFSEQLIYSQSNYTVGVIQDALLRAKLRLIIILQIWYL